MVALERLVREAFPGSVVHLEQALVGLDAFGGGDDDRRLPRPDERARDDAVEVHAFEACRQCLRLRAARLVERHIETLPQVLLRDRPIGQAVAREDEDQHRESV